MIRNKIFNINFQETNSSSKNIISKEIQITSNKVKNHLYKKSPRFSKNSFQLSPKSNYNVSETHNLQDKLNILPKDNNLVKENFLKNMNDEELNSLEYTEAINLDKRTFLQYYFSLIKKKQLLLFAFCRNNDYNLITLKISLFILAFSLYFTMNAFFFNDDTMHDIYEDESYYNIFYQIPIILYSAIICSIFNSVLRHLSLSESNILSISQENNYQNALLKSEKILKCLKIKFFCFFLLSLVLLLFCWYYISCFCAVYNNTQLILISDSFISFILSMLYPFVLNLIPVLFRIPALRAINKNRKCMYKISNIINFFI